MNPKQILMLLKGRILYLFIIVLFSNNMLACSSGDDGETGPPRSGKEEVPNETNVVSDSEIPGNYIINIEPETKKVIKNPLNGWVMYSSMDANTNFWDTYENLNVPGVSMLQKTSDYAGTFYLRVGWHIMNPREGVYGWDTDEKLKWLIDNARQRGLRLAFRVVVDSRDKATDFTPAYVKEAGAEGYTSQTGSKTVWSPYPDDPIFQEKYSVFVKAFAQKYNDPDVVDFIDGYGLGKWGEAHSVKYKDEANREKVLKWVVDLYTENFTRIPLALNYHRLVGVNKDWGSADPKSAELLDYAFNKGYILRHDAFGMSGYYQQWERDYAEKWRYKRPIIMEGGWIVSSHSYWTDPRKYASIEAVRQGEFDDSKVAHVNMMDFRYGNETKTWFSNAFSLVNEFVSEGGYRLYPDKLSLPKEVKNGSEIRIKHNWNNLGWGYCPTNIPAWNQKYKVAFALLQKNTVVKLYVDDQTDLSTWLKGNATNYEFRPQIDGISAGTYTWAVAIVDKTKDNVKGINISVSKNITSSGWLKLFDVVVK